MTLLSLSLAFWDSLKSPLEVPLTCSAPEGLPCNTLGLSETLSGPLVILRDSLRPKVNLRLAAEITFWNRFHTVDRTAFPCVFLLLQDACFNFATLPLILFSYQNTINYAKDFHFKIIIILHVLILSENKTKHFARLCFH